MQKLKNHKVPKIICAFWVLIELTFIRVYFCIPLWKSGVGMFHCFRKSIWVGFTIFSLIILALAILEYLTFKRTKQSRLILAILVWTQPLVFWLYVDFFILRLSSISDLLIGLLAQVSTPIIMSLVLFFDPVLREYFQTNEFGMRDCWPVRKKASLVK